MPQALINITNTTGITDLLQAISTETSLYPVFGLLGSYVTMFLLVARITDSRSSFLGTSLVHVIIGTFLLNIGLPTIWFYGTVVVFVVSLFTWWWSG